MKTFSLLQCTYQASNRDCGLDQRPIQNCILNQERSECVRNHASAKMSSNTSTDVHAAAAPLIGTSNQGISAGKFFVVYTGRIGPHARRIGRKPIHSERECCLDKLIAKGSPTRRENGSPLAVHTHTVNPSFRTIARELSIVGHRAVSNGHMPLQQS
jgi:hypothetical protein